MVELVLFSKEHIKAANSLEVLCFSEPWSEKSLELLLDGSNFGIVALYNGIVVAYGGMTCVLDEGAVTNIAVHPEYRRRGIGKSVVKAMLREAQERGIAKVFLEVRASNTAARALYSSEGFYECGIRRSFYRHPAEDAVQMVYCIK